MISRTDGVNLRKRSRKFKMNADMERQKGDFRFIEPG